MQPTHPVGLHKSHKHWEENRRRCCLRVLSEEFHSLIKGVLFWRGKWEADLVIKHLDDHWEKSGFLLFSITCAILASSCSFLSLLSLCVIKSLSMVLWPCMLYSLRLSSMPLCSSLTSSRTFSSDTVCTWGALCHRTSKQMETAHGDISLTGKNGVCSPAAAFST